VGGWALKRPERIGMWTYFIPELTTYELSPASARKLTIVLLP